LAVDCTKSLLLILCMEAFSSPLMLGGWTQSEQHQAEDLLSRTFVEAKQITSMALSLRPSELDSVRTIAGRPFGSDTLHLLAAMNEGKVVGYAVIDNVRGKDMPITYCVVVDEKLSVHRIDILAYRESFGGEIRNESWLRQFFGKRPGDELRPGKEIRSITGATISARAVTLGVRKVLSVLHVVQKRLPRTTGDRR